jgi:hypothetical protein
LELKNQIRDREGIRPDQQCQIVAGHQVREDEMTLEEANIRQGALIQLVLPRR